MLLVWTTGCKEQRCFPDVGTAPLCAGLDITRNHDLRAIDDCSCLRPLGYLDRRHCSYLKKKYERRNEGALKGTCSEHVRNCCNRFNLRVARQQLCKHGPTRNNRRGCVFYVVRVEQRWNNGVMQPVSKQRLRKHNSA
jgi:hypothetical protein